MNKDQLLNLEVILCIKSDLLTSAGDILRDTCINLGMNENLGGIAIEDKNVQK